MSAYADLDTRDYKISVLFFKHLPGDKNTSARLLAPIVVNQNSIESFLPKSQSSLADLAYSLSKSNDYSILYHAAWNAALSYGQAQTFYLHQSLSDGKALNILMNITLKYHLEVNMQSQLLTLNSAGFYHIDALNDLFQTPNNQIQYIDGPIYGALIKITRASS